MKQRKQRIKWRIRNAAFRDAPEISNLIKKHPKEVLPRSISDIVQNTDRFVVAEAEDGTLLGVASWQILPELGRVQDPSVEIKSVSVAPEAQGLGVGTALIRAVIRRVKVHGRTLWCFFSGLLPRWLPRGAKGKIHKLYAV